ncbi:MAG TPA: MaoC family dehydratase N-terminal domain-containing protein [Nocardioidaceae bacterium]|nr:MaoC family dehydratase N-terminal domain-containing protein [Nocardioidaceae bacterium]
MAVDAGLAGRTFPPTPAVEVTREQIAEFRAAIGAGDSHTVDALPGHPDTAPPTFAIVVAFAAMRDLLEDPGSGLSLPRVVHGDQRFVYERHIRVGDTLRAQLSVESVRSMGGADILGTRTEISTDQGEPVCTAYATLMHRGDGAV